MSDDRLLIEKEDPELVAHLQDISQASFADMESLARMRERLLQAEAPDAGLSAHTPALSEDGIILPFPAKQQTRKRPGWVRRLNTLAAVLAIVVLVGAMAGTFAYLRGSRSASSSTNLPGKQATSVATPTASGSSGYMPSSHLPVSLGTVFMADAHTAWVQTVTPLPGEGDVAGPLLRTTNGGKTWQDVTPPQIGFDAAEVLYAVDATTAWMIPRPESGLFSTSGTSIILRTVDGGKTWQTLSLPSPSLGERSGSVDIRFVSRDLGWISTAQQDNNGQITMTNYLTIDGAKSWQKLASIPVTPSAENQIPNISLHFVNARAGWLSIISSQGYSLYATGDGGQSWQKETLPVTLKAPSANTDGTYESSSVHFFDARNGYLIVSDTGPTTTSYTLYPTHDGGQTWQSGSKLDDGNDRTISPLNFLNAQQILLTSSSGISLYTLTQGQWVKTSSHALSHGFLRYNSFADSSHGLIVVDETRSQMTSSGDDIRLFMTSDGGASWSELRAIPTVSKLTPATMGYLTSAGWTYFTAHEGFGPGNFTAQIQTGQGNAAPATLPHLVTRKWLVRFMCMQDHTVKMELNGKGFTVTNCAQQPTSTVITLSSAQAFSSLNVHASNGGRWLAVLLACTNEKLCK